MSNKKTDWKSKYYELRSRHINAMDVSFRLGFQEGLKAAELQNMQMQLQQAQSAAANMVGGGVPAEGMSAQETPPEGAMTEDGQIPPEADQEVPEENQMVAEEPEEGGELDSNINELENLVSKKEKIDFSQMLKSIHKSGVNKKNTSELSEAHQKIGEIVKKWETK